MDDVKVFQCSCEFTWRTKTQKGGKGPKNKKKTVVRCKKKQQKKPEVVSVVKLHHLLWQIFLKFNLKNKRVRYDSIN